MVITETDPGLSPPRAEAQEINGLIKRYEAHKSSAIYQLRVYQGKVYRSVQVG